MRKQHIKWRYTAFLILFPYLVVQGIPSQTADTNPLGDKSPPELLEQWDRASRGERVLIVNTLIEKRDNALPALRAAVRTGGTGEKRLAIKLLGEMRDEGAIPDLLVAIDKGGRDTRIRAINAVREIGDRSVLPKLKELVNSVKDKEILICTI